MSLLLIAAVAAVFTGALFQRLSGIGFSLVAAPALALISGPRSGVTLTNLLAIVVALVVARPGRSSAGPSPAGRTAPGHHRLRWAGIAAITAALCGLLIGQLAARRIDGDRARHAAIIIAGLAALVTVAKGLLS